jgi:hypothetical protein
MTMMMSHEKTIITKTATPAEALSVYGTYKLLGSPLHQLRCC